MRLKPLINSIVESDLLHARWLNTLSYLENCGARKIAACEHPTLVKEQMLKHAAEEFRHAHHLKRQIEKVSKEPFETYSPHLMLAGYQSLQYLTKLDLLTCRYLKGKGFANQAIRQAAYLLVTYSIELRAEKLYPQYDEILRKNNSRVVVKSIMLEEKEHLEEMKEGLRSFPSGFKHASEICALETVLYTRWVCAIEKQLSTYPILEALR